LTVVVHVPAALLPFTSGRERIDLEQASTVAEALARLTALYPGVRDRVLNEQGEVRPHVNVFVRDESIRDTGGIHTPLSDGDEVFIIPAVSGGARGCFE
jgi:sulfur-carrier protein